jgi:hypothetical protein
LTADPHETSETEEQTHATGEPVPAQPPVSEPGAALYAEAATEAPALPVAVSDSAPEPGAALYADAATEVLLVPVPPVAMTAPAEEPVAALYADAATEAPAATEAEVSQAIAELAGTLPVEPMVEAGPTNPPARRSWFHRSPRPAPAKPSKARRFLGFGVAFVVSALLGLFLVSAVAMAF